MEHLSKLNLLQLVTHSKFLLSALQSVTTNSSWWENSIGFLINDTLNCFVEAGILAGYAWNSAPIDSTDMIRSIPVIGRELRFPLDTNLTALPKLTDNQANSGVEYLCLTDKDRIFSTKILKILIEDR